MCIYYSHCQLTTSPAGERKAETPQRLKDVKPATDILEFLWPPGPAIPASSVATSQLWWERLFDEPMSPGSWSVR